MFTFVFGKTSIVFKDLLLPQCFYTLAVILIIIIKDVKNWTRRNFDNEMKFRKNFSGCGRRTISTRFKASVVKPQESTVDVPGTSVSGVKERNRWWQHLHVERERCTVGACQSLVLENCFVRELCSTVLVWGYQQTKRNSWNVCVEFFFSRAKWFIEACIHGLGR